MEVKFLDFPQATQALGGRAGAGSQCPVSCMVSVSGQVGRQSQRLGLCQHCCLSHGEMGWGSSRCFFFSEDSVPSLQHPFFTLTTKLNQILVLNVIGEYILGSEQAVKSVEYAGN